jgi:ACR3 family arsenite efflux pump ArsB
MLAIALADMIFGLNIGNTLTSTIIPLVKVMSLIGLVNVAGSLQKRMYKGKSSAGSCKPDVC